ncbi:SusD/RagB family nutrient-binding outer membrane lipoprotein [Aliifodinibius sp. S!AR15-10]|uniref:SusD/RagB family nutrient-binding outer membrane lipoprotein n=1 Tax=Aliifodinibius sp. S!AR15-10 TaxID=2950437 RepID=UPI0028612076|nr:SusD/RagB family nutrient-binding outer membrane lipoprotein [Aliifodinibius sp. S!AR15-10]MDR8394227.1 SusD/RagB family nutrient-binding outer membrane lipoprotein [Aliifodinibius sp. S!AR15-10]
MKNKKIRYMVVCLLVSLFTLGSCDTSTLHSLNENPTVAEELDPGFILAYTQLQTSGERFENWRAVLIYQSTMVQHFAALAGYWAGDKYTFNDQYSGSLWARAYTNYIKDLVNLVEITDPTVEGQEQWVNYHAIARIWKVFAFHRVTDHYGDVPYSQAGKGFIEGTFFPSYDPQEEIYLDMLNELEAAAALLTSDASNPGSQDLIYGGNVDKWRKFAYSMMLRLGMRMTKVDSDGAQDWVQQALAGGVMESNDDICYIEHTDGPEGINRNGIGEVFLWNGQAFTNDDVSRLSKTFVDWMAGKSDPRLEKLSWVVNGGPPQGLPNGYDATTIQNFDPNYGEGDDYSRINPLFVLTSSPMIFQTYAEVEFLTAEAIERGWANGDAATHYENGVRAAMQMYSLYDPTLEVDAADINDYIAANPYDSNSWDQLLGEQYWAATFLNEYEAYANWRRTGYPELTPVNYPGNESNGTIPRRLRYPLSERSGNPDAFNEAVNRQGPDQFTTRMWWDVE